jgi:hypothetical protein
MSCSNLRRYSSSFDARASVKSTKRFLCFLQDRRPFCLSKEKGDHECGQSQTPNPTLRRVLGSFYRIRWSDLDYSKEDKAKKESVKIPKQTACSEMQIDGMTLSNVKTDPDVSKYADVATQTDSMGVQKSQPAGDVDIGRIPTTPGRSKSFPFTSSKHVGDCTQCSTQQLLAGSSSKSSPHSTGMDGAAQTDEINNADVIGLRLLTAREHRLSQISKISIAARHIKPPLLLLPLQRCFKRHQTPKIFNQELEV